MLKTSAVVVFIVALLFVGSCGKSDEKRVDYSSVYKPAVSNSDALAGFLEIIDNTLYITPVEVFMLYEVDVGHDFFQDPALREIIFVERNDYQRLAELELTLDDFPSGVHIRPNWHSDKHWYYVEQANIQRLSFEITSDTEFVFVDSDRSNGSTNVLEYFLPYLSPSVVHFIEVYDGKVIRLVQEFLFTM